MELGVAEGAQGIEGAENVYVWKQVHVWGGRRHVYVVHEVRVGREERVGEVRVRA